VAWAALALGMVIILIWSAWHVGLKPGQWATLIISTVILAGLCVWIIWHEDEEEERVSREKQEESSQGQAGQPPAGV